MNDGEFEPRLLKGRKLDKAKIERWKKRDGIVGGGSQNEAARSSGKLACYDEIPLLTRSVRNGG